MAIRSLENKHHLDTWMILELSFFKASLYSDSRKKVVVTYFRAITIVYNHEVETVMGEFQQLLATLPGSSSDRHVRHLEKSRGAGATRTRKFIIVYRSHIQTLTNLDQLVKISATKIRYSGGNMCKPLELPSIHELHNINLCNYQSVPMQLLAHFRHVCQHS